MRHLALLSLIALPTAASAVPLEFNHQGRLMDALAQPLTGSMPVTFTIYDAASGSSQLWTETQTVSFDDGYYSVQLGSSTTLDASAFDDDDAWLAISVDGGAELPTRLRLVAVPYAIRALNVDGGGTVNAAEIQVNGTTVIDSSGTVVAPSSGITVADFSCTDGQVLGWNSGWGCVADGSGSHTHDASHIDNGVLAIERLPVGVSTNTVSAGDHSHSPNDVGAVATAGGTMTGALNGTSASFSGGVQVGSSTPCNNGAAGTLRYSSGALELCDGAAWVAVGASAPAQTAADAQGSCLDILNANPGAPDGTYWIDPDGSGSATPRRTWCDMTTDGGGWTLIQQSSPFNGAWNLCQPGAVGELDWWSPNSVGHPAKWSNADVNGVWSSDKQVLIKYDENRAGGGTGAWDKVCKVDFVSSYVFHTDNNVSNMSQLENDAPTCFVGTHQTLTSNYTHGNMCGWGFRRNSDDYIIQAFNTGYSPSGGVCPTGWASRSWLGPGNNGCNMTRYYVR